MTKENRVRQQRAVQALAALVAFEADAGSYPERLEQAVPDETDRSALNYQRCAKSDGFQLSYNEAGPGFLPSDYARSWNPSSQRWEAHDMGQLPPCE